MHDSLAVLPVPEEDDSSAREKLHPLTTVAPNSKNHDLAWDTIPVLFCKWTTIVARVTACLVCHAIQPRICRATSVLTGEQAARRRFRWNARAAYQALGVRVSSARRVEMPERQGGRTSLESRGL